MIPTTSMAVPRHPTSSSLAVIALCLFGATSLAIATFASPEAGVALLLGGVFVTTVFLLAGNDAVGLGLLLVTMSAVQRAVFSLSGASISLYLDDVVLVTMALLTAYRIIKAGRGGRWLLLGGVLVIVAVVLGFARAAGTEIGVYQARQILVPAILVLFGASLSREEIARLRPVILVFGVAAAIYALFEQLDFHPLDPRSYGGFQSTGEMSSYGREFPGFYYYYFDGNEYFVRSGGFLLNPPSLGMYIAAALGWLWYGHKRESRKVAPVLLSVLLIAGTIVTMARGGFVILAVLLIQPWVLRRAGKFGYVLVAGAVGAVAFTQFVGAGSSARHSDGALFGFSYALTHPLGGGFGTAGNAVHTLTDEIGEAGESLTTVFLAGCGWIALILIAALLFRGMGRGGGIAGAALIAAMVVAIFSETAGGLDAAAFIWILGGTALAAQSDSEPELEHQAPTRA